MTENCCQLHSGHRTFVFSNNRNSESGKSAVFTNCRCLWILLRGAQGRGPAADQRVLSDEDSPQSQDRTSKTWPWPGGPAALLAPRLHPLRVPVWRVEQRAHCALRAECSLDLTHHCSQSRVLSGPNSSLLSNISPEDWTVCTTPMGRSKVKILRPIAARPSSYHTGSVDW